MFLFHCLRHSPADRPDITELRHKLQHVAGHIEPLRWPIDPG
jgi:hypothetical protein